MAAVRMRTTMLPSGEAVSILGQGTWGMAEDAPRRADEIAALRLGLNLGVALIDTLCPSGARGYLAAETVVPTRCFWTTRLW